MTNSVIRRPLGETELEVSEIGFGALEIGRDWAHDVNDDPFHPNEQEAARVLNELLDLGINFIDTAPAYWESEEFIGKAIAHRREEFILATKVGEHCDRSGSVYDYSAEATERFIDTSLERLKTDRIDLIQIHSASMEVLDKGETWKAMDKARRAGKVRHIGMTGGVAECERALEIGGYETVQVPYNLLNLDAENRLFELARKRGAGVIIMRGLAGGKLTQKFKRLEDESLREAIAQFSKFMGEDGAKDLTQLAIAYVLGETAVSSVILGSRKIEHIKANLASAKFEMPSELREQVREAAKKIQAQAW